MSVEIDELEDLSTAMKALSMRRENLYRAMEVHTPGSSPWLANDREIDSINESMTSIEVKRTEWRRAWGRRGQEAS